jgi:hypothetical protein
MSLSEGDIPERRNAVLQTQSKTWLWTGDLSKRYRRSTRTIKRWITAGKLPPPTRMPNGRGAWTNTVIEEHERGLVGGEAA